MPLIIMESTSANVIGKHVTVNENTSVVCIKMHEGENCFKAKIEQMPGGRWRIYNDNFILVVGEES